MEWGTRTAIDTYRKLHNRVPDVVYDLGVVGKEPMVWLLAHRAVDAARVVVKIGGRLGEGWGRESNGDHIHHYIQRVSKYSISFIAKEAKKQNYCINT